MKRISLAIGIFTFACAFSAAQAVPPADGVYHLHNHPFGNQNPPPYGLRLDGLDGDFNSVYTFDFDFVDSSAREAAMYLDLDRANGTIRIWGDVYGGLNDPMNQTQFASLSSEAVGWWNIDFTYRMNVTYFTGGDGFGLDDIKVSAPDAMNNGTITPEFVSAVHPGTQTFTDYATTGLSFRFGDDSASPGHRNAPGLSGWGWVKHDALPWYQVSSDWLFTAEPIPAPGAVLLGLMGLGIAGVVRRRLPSS